MVWVGDGVGVVGAAQRGNGLDALGVDMGGGVEGEFARGTASGCEVVGRLGLDGGRQPQGGISQSAPDLDFCCFVPVWIDLASAA